jgi:Na+/melibiose symporter-like transporter
MRVKRKQVLNYAGGPGNFLNNPYLQQEPSVEDGVEMKDANQVTTKEPQSEAEKYKCIVVSVLCLVNLTANSAYSSIAPFYPAEALAKGVPEASFGFIFAGYSISMCVFAPLYSHMLTKYGRKRVLILGCLCESLAMICFGLFIYI